MCTCKSRVNVIVNECCDCNAPGSGNNPSHNHDDRYYTKEVVDTLLSGKAPLHHTHTSLQIDDFRSAVEEMVNTLPKGETNIQVNGVPISKKAVNFKNDKGIVLRVENRDDVADITVASENENIQLTKLGKQAGDIVIHSITKPNPLLDYGPVEVLKFAPNQQNSQLYSMSFNNADADQFDFNPQYTQFTGVMKPVNQKDYLMEKSEWTAAGILFEVEIDTEILVLESIVAK